MKTFCYSILFNFLLFFLSSCRSTEKIVQVEVEKPVIVEHIKTDTFYSTLYDKDSIYIHDSVSTKVILDTVYIERTKVQYRYRYITKDSVTIVHDTIPNVVEVQKPFPVEVEKVKYKTPRLVKWLAGAGLIFLLYLLFLAIRLFRKR